MLYEAGVAPEQAQALLRHAQVQTTFDVYRDIRAAQIKKIQQSVYGIDIT